MYGQSMMDMVDVLCSRIALSQWEEDCPWCLLVRTNQRLKRKPKHHRRRTGDTVSVTDSPGHSMD